MKIGIMLPVGDADWPSGPPTWRDMTEIARTVEAEGLDSIWVADHLFYEDPEGQRFGVHEAWTLLTGLAAVTERVELGPLVLCASFRDPGVTAKMAATLDMVSNGRLILGLGAGWHDPEYEAFGLPTDHRVGRFEEALQIIIPLLRGERVTYAGKWHRTNDAVLLPAPTRRIPILIAAKGPRMLELTGRWADAWNTAWYGLPSDRLHASLASIGAAVEAAGRPAESVVLTVGIDVIDPEQPDSGEANPRALSGSVAGLADAIRTYEGLGVGHLMVGLDPITTRSVRRLAEAVELAGIRRG
jgi:probable F420-dependent oxidoreductase